MGRKYKGKRTQARDIKGKGSEPARYQDKRQRASNGVWHEPKLDNALFEDYYKAQNIVPQGEWDAFLTLLRTPLPTSFRINGSGKFAAGLRDHLENDFFSQFGSGPLVVDGEELAPPRALEWYPSRLAWQFAFSRTQLRKHPALAAIHEMVKRENEAGSITRQEVVSMVPALLLDVQPEHKVLDTCASPGSKTVQILEMLHHSTSLPSGFVVANDADAQRCNLLTHHTKRTCSPALVITNHDATLFPVIRNDQGEAIRFDRILCDVPCSGDGTMRKAPDIWRRWSPANGNGLHGLQVRITQHAARLLVPGGRMVYSTCSFNPVEDEAVVAEVLREAEGALELVDVSDSLPALRRVPGLRTWGVQAKEGFFASWDAAQAGGATRLLRSMLPPAPDATPPLERCMRVLPHHGDTGGFFIAVMRKTRDLPTPAPAQRAVPAAEKAQEPAFSDAGEPVGDAAYEEVKELADEAADATKTFAQAIYQQDIPVATEAAADSAACVEAVVALVGGSSAPAQSDAASAAGPAASSAQGPDTPKANGGPAQGPEPVGAAKRGAGGQRWRHIDPVLPFTDAEELATLADFYGWEAGTIPLGQQLITRSQPGVAQPKRLYFVNAGLRDLLTADTGGRLKVTSVGLKVLERQTAAATHDGRTTCAYRIAQEGLPLLLPHLTRQRISISAAEALRLVTEMGVPLPPELRIVTRDLPGTSGAAEKAEDEGDEAAGEPPAKKARVEGDTEGPQEGKSGKERKLRVPLSDEATLAQLVDVQGGCCVCVLRSGDATALGLESVEAVVPGAVAAHAPLAMACWRGRASLSVLVAKAECALLADKLGIAMAARAAALQASGAGAGEAASAQPLQATVAEVAAAVEKVKAAAAAGAGAAGTAAEGEQGAAAGNEQEEAMVL
ncbi:hypothetical protein WJX81_004428 [Elliptochloris bilobata]|uniref:SAM-dependent MTase RsmB/NOP-type domain-containing protein n=1 Tax=Elliptochloris bilobata TaxID=381761 RepID=A0AAW1QIF6_9CHLO